MRIKNNHLAKSSTKKGSDLEEAMEEFFNCTFKEIGYGILEVRQQKSGTQNGFDIIVRFLDENDNERTLFFECKNYDSELDWVHIYEKVLQLSTTDYKVDGFIAVSPKVQISNIKHNTQNSMQSTFKHPVDHWSPDNNIEEIFSLNDSVYEKIYGKKKITGLKKEELLKRFKDLIKSILNRKDAFKYLSLVNIPDSDIEILNDEKTSTLDEKLNEVISTKDPIRDEYHLYRCRYRLYLDSLVDINNDLREKILKWQDNLRHKAKRLTRNFQTNQDYTPITFFNDFYDKAETDVKKLFENENLKGDEEKLMSGVIFELAAECPLDWRKTTTYAK